MNTVMAIVLSRFMCNNREVGLGSVPNCTRLAYHYCRTGTKARSLRARFGGSSGVAMVREGSIPPVRARAWWASSWRANGSRVDLRDEWSWTIRDHGVRIPCSVRDVHDHGWISPSVQRVIGCGRPYLEPSEHRPHQIPSHEKILTIRSALSASRRSGRRHHPCPAPVERAVHRRCQYDGLHRRVCR